MVSVVQIVKWEEGEAGNGKIVLDEKAFSKVLKNGNAKKKSVVVISICGEYGKGKSLMANFFFQYLKNKGYLRKDLSWLTEMSVDSIGCDEPGIFLFEEVIPIKKVAVLILLVQGRFSIESNNKISSQIFALGTLLSSVQILNLQTHIHGKDVVFLKDFVDYASKIGVEVNMRGKMSVALKVLIRDWPYPKDRAYGYEEGIKYLELALDSLKFETAELGFLYNRLGQIFNNVSGFLMPHVGLSIRSRKHSNVKDLDKNFQDCVQRFIGEFLAPDKLLVKQTTVGGKRADMNGEHLFDHARKCIVEIHNQPEIESTKETPVPKQRSNVQKPEGPAKPRRLLKQDTITEHRAVTIFNLEDGEVTLMADDFERILLQPEIGDRPISIISIVGSFRKGKSFLLNFFLRYMRNKGYNEKNRAWMGDENTPINDGFLWKSGMNPHTKGIMLYTEPFIVDTENGEIAVLFMDTQGLFDANTTKEKNMMIFAMNTIICSVQVLNISMNLEETDLEFLQLFTEYARIVQNESRDGQFLQSLKFLIRDWQYTQDFAYGTSGGEQYMQSYMKRRDKEDELKYVREFIFSKYKSIGCFLMPHPGLELPQLRDEATLKDLADDFKNQLTPLVESILNPENLIVKRFRDKPMSARALYASATKYAEAISKGNLPKLSTIMDVLEEASNNERRKECLEYYMEAMKKELKNTNNCSSDENIEAVHEKAKEEAIGKFFAVKRVGSNKKRDLLIKHVKEEIDNACPRFMAKRDHAQALENLENISEFQRVLKKYKDLMDRIIDKPIEPKDFDAFEAECWKKAEQSELKDFKNMSNLTLRSTENARDIVASLRRKENKEKYDLLVEEMQMPENYFQVTNASKEDHSQVEQPIRPTTFEKVSKNAKNVFQAYEDAVKNKNLTGRHKREILYNQARQGFDEKQSGGNFKKFIQLLEKMATKNEQTTIGPNEKVVSNIRLRGIVNLCLRQFEEELNQYRGNFVRKNRLESLLSERKVVALERYEHHSSNEASKEIIEKHRSDLLANLEAKIKIAEEENERDRIHFQNVKEEQEKRIIKKYHSNMDSILESGYIVEDKLKQYHKNLLEELEKEFSADDLPFYSENKYEDKLFVNFKSDVKRQLDRLFEKKKAWNKKNHGLIVRALTNFFYR